jgi:hypothetical protein
MRAIIARNPGAKLNHTMLRRGMVPMAPLGEKLAAH